MMSRVDSFQKAGDGLETWQIVLATQIIFDLIELRSELGSSSWQKFNLDDITFCSHLFRGRTKKLFEMRFIQNYWVSEI